MIFFKRLTQVLQKTRALFDSAISAKNIEELEQVLLQADIGVKSTEYIVERIKKIKIADQNYKDALTQILTEILQSNPYVLPKDKIPQIIMIVGIPGSGKTTTVAKLANLFTKQGKKVLISASDTYRAAASSQLGIWAKQVGVEIVYSEKRQDAGTVAFDAIQKGKAGNYDAIFIDTAGRLHTRKDLMEEAKKIKRVCQKFRVDAPDEIWLVLDATVGQNGIEQAKIFHQELTLSGLIITKLDGTAKGGVVIPIVLELKLPIRYLGIGETSEDLQEFSPQDYIQALLE